jgi:hypothetical protein
MQRWVVIVSYIVSAQNFTQLGALVKFLCPIIWSRVSGLMRFLDGSDSECASNVVQISGKALVRLRKCLNKRSGKKA